MRCGEYAYCVISTETSPLSPDTIRNILLEICPGRGIERVELFGSIARGDERPDSDVDLLIEFSADRDPSLVELGDLKEALEERLGRRVDVLTRRAVERSRNPIRRRAILSDPIPVYVR